jgi:hypothetical protein
MIMISTKNIDGLLILKPLAYAASMLIQAYSGRSKKYLEAMEIAAAMA